MRTGLMHLLTTLALLAPLTAAEPPKAFTPPAAWEQRLADLERRVGALEGKKKEAAPAPKAAAVAPKSKPAKPEEAAVWVGNRTGNTTGCGSGVVIASEGGRSLVLTCAHVAHPAGSLVVWHTDVYRPATLVGVGKVNGRGPDLALLEVAHDLPAAKLAAVSPAAGEPLTVVGWGGRQNIKEPALKPGVSLKSPFVEPTLYGNMPSVQGDSGGGVFNARGELVGILWGGNPGESLAVPLDSLTTFTATTLAERPAVFPRLRAVLAALNPAKVPDVKVAEPATTTAPVTQFPPASSCPGGVCPTGPRYAPAPQYLPRFRPFRR